MSDLIYALFELLLASLSGRGKTVGEARKEFKERIKDVPRRDKLLLLFVIASLVTVPVFIIIFLIALE